MATLALRSTLSLLAALACAVAQAAVPDADQARRIAEHYIAARQADAAPQETYEAGDVVAADLDGDGRSEVVVLWTRLGPTYWHHGVTVLAQQGARYAPAGETAEPLGSVEDMTVRDGVIELKTKWPGPNDPRCCPSVPKTLRYRWSAGRLAPAK